MEKQEVKAPLGNKLLLTSCLIDLTTVERQSVELYNNSDSSNLEEHRQVLKLIRQAKTLLMEQLTLELLTDLGGEV